MSTTSTQEELKDSPAQPETQQTPETAKQNPARKAFEKIRSLPEFKQHEERFKAFLSEQVNGLVNRSAEKFARFVSTTELPADRVAAASQKSRVQERLATNEAQAQTALTRVKDGIAAILSKHVNEKLNSTPQPQAQAEQAAKPTTQETIPSTQSEATKTEITKAETKDNVAERRETIKAEAQEQRASLAARLINGGVDLLPVVGGGKMVVESFAGKDALGNKLTGAGRIMHGVMGAVCVGLDLTGVGEAITLTGKGLELVAKLGEHLAEKGAVEAAAVLAKTGAFMAEHPSLLSKAESWAEGKLRSVVKDARGYQKDLDKDLRTATPANDNAGPAKGSAAAKRFASKPAISTAPTETVKQAA